MSQITKAIEEVKKNPNYRRNGFFVDVQDNGTIVLQTKEVRGPYSTQISMEDSDHLLNLIKLSVDESCVEQS